MNDLHDYIIDSYINETLSEITSNDPIYEGRILDGIKKLWRWITRKNKKFARNAIEKPKTDNIKIKIKDYEYSKLQQLQLSNDMKKSRDAVNKYADKKNDIKVSMAEDIKAKQIAGILVYVRGDKSPIAKEYWRFEGYAHIFALEINPKYRERGLGRVLIKHAKERLKTNSNSLAKGFTINYSEANSKKLYQNIGFNETFEDEDNNVKIMWAKYEDIKTDN